MLYCVSDACEGCSTEGAVGDRVVGEWGWVRGRQPGRRCFPCVMVQHEGGKSKVFSERKKDELGANELGIQIEIEIGRLAANELGKERVKVADPKWRWKLGKQMQLTNMQKTVNLRVHRGVLQFVNTKQAEKIGWRGSASVLVEIEVPRSVEGDWGVNINWGSALLIMVESACALRHLSKCEGCHDVREVVTQAGVESDEELARGRRCDAQEVNCELQRGHVGRRRSCTTWGGPAPAWRRRSRFDRGLRRGAKERRRARARPLLIAGPRMGVRARGMRLC